MKLKTKKVVKHISDDSDNDSKLEIQNKTECNEESQDSESEESEKEVKNC